MCLGYPNRRGGRDRRKDREMGPYKDKEMDRQTRTPALLPGHPWGQVGLCWGRVLPGFVDWQSCAQEQGRCELWGLALVFFSAAWGSSSSVHTLPTTAWRKWLWLAGRLLHRSTAGCQTCLASGSVENYTESARGLVGDATWLRLCQLSHGAPPGRNTLACFLSLG